jgi:hypothetical protein
MENIVRIEYPSVGSTGLGKALGRLYDSLPMKVCGVKLSHILFTLPTSPLGIALYGWLKTLGRRYVLTDKSVQIRPMLFQGVRAQVPLADVAEVAVEQLPGQEFYKAADINLLAADGRSLLRLEGVVRAEVIRQSILEARDAQAQVAASLATIQARQTAKA